MFLGQHFLINEEAIQASIDALDIREGDLVIELGSGKGALTYPLLYACKNVGAKLIGIEKDRTLALSLYQSLQKDEPSFSVRDKDLLTELPKIVEEEKPARYHIIGNLPYYISGKILRTITELPTKPESAVLMFQLEVAQRLTNASDKTSLLSASVQIWANAEIIFHLKETDFDPPPKVKSAIVKLTRKDKFPIDTTRYFRFIKAAFTQPRKTLLNNLDQAGIPKAESEKTLQAMDLSATIRSSQLSVDQLYLLSEKLDIPTSS